MHTCSVHPLLRQLARRAQAQPQVFYVKVVKLSGEGVEGGGGGGGGGKCEVANRAQ